MAKVLLSVKSLLIASLALNAGLILRSMYQQDGSQELAKQQPSVKYPQPQQQQKSRAAAHVSLRNNERVVGAAAADDGNRVINLIHGDPTMYEAYWQRTGEKTTLVIPGWQSISYLSDTTNICWFLEPELAAAVTRLHETVGNAVTDGRHIVVGTGSSQLIMAALYALSTAHNTQPIHVVSAAPYYSSYPAMANFVKSGLYQWAGDARTFDKEGPYIELVTSPNNPDGFTRGVVVNRSGGFWIHDHAYYWPQYAPIPAPADHDLMLFTTSKSTGHAGIRIGWALVKDKEVAKRMVKYIEVHTIGASKDSQHRATNILNAVSNSLNEGENFFQFGRQQLEDRWAKLRVAVRRSGRFSLPEFAPGFCAFSGLKFEPMPAFAWLKCEGSGESDDCESLLRRNNIMTRGGEHFGADAKYARVSMMDRDETFQLLVQRLATIS